MSAVVEVREASYSMDSNQLCNLGGKKGKAGPISSDAIAKIFLMHTSELFHSAQSFCVKKEKSEISLFFFERSVTE